MTGCHPHPHPTPLNRLHPPTSHPPAPVITHSVIAGVLQEPVTALMQRAVLQVGRSLQDPLLLQML